jgi:hypothetical protein
MYDSGCPQYFSATRDRHSLGHYSRMLGMDLVPPLPPSPHLRPLTSDKAILNAAICFQNSTDVFQICIQDCSTIALDCLFRRSVSCRSAAHIRAQPPSILDGSARVNTNAWMYACRWLLRILCLTGLQALMNLTCRYASQARFTNAHSCKCTSFVHLTLCKKNLGRFHDYEYVSV